MKEGKRGQKMKWILCQKHYLISNILQWNCKGLRARNGSGLVLDEQYTYFLYLFTRSNA